MNDEDWSREMILANYLHYRGFDQQKIYEHLGRVHQSTISRWIGKGRARGLWSEHRVFDYERLLPEELAYVTDWENQHGLRKALIAWCDQYSVEPPETLVVDSGSTGSSRDAWAQRLRAFA